MNKESKIALAVISISALVVILLLLWMAGFDLSGLEIHKGFKLG